MHYFATITPKPEHFEAAREAVLTIVERTRAEEGCLRFELFASPDGKTLYIDEIWRDADAFNFHHAQDYTRDVFNRYRSWLAQPPLLTKIVPVSPELQDTALEA